MPVNHAGKLSSWGCCDSTSELESVFFIPRNLYAVQQLDVLNITTVNMTVCQSAMFHKTTVLSRFLGQVPPHRSLKLPMWGSKHCLSSAVTLKHCTELDWTFIDTVTWWTCFVMWRIGYTHTNTTTTWE